MVGDGKWLEMGNGWRWEMVGVWNDIVHCFIRPVLFVCV